MRHGRTVMVRARNSRPSFESPRKSAAPQDEGFETPRKTARLLGGEGTDAGDHFIPPLGADVHGPRRARRSPFDKSHISL
jgi:hypothetical protein